MLSLYWPTPPFVKKYTSHRRIPLTQMDSYEENVSMSGRQLIVMLARKAY